MVGVKLLADGVEVSDKQEGKARMIPVKWIPVGDIS